MVEVMYEISKEEYDKGQKEGAKSLVSETIQLGYGCYCAKVFERDGKYYLRYDRGSSCD